MNNHNAHVHLKLFNSLSKDIAVDRQEVLDVVIEDENE